MNKEIVKVVNFLSPDDPERSLDYYFSQWAKENFDRLTPEKILDKISQMIDDPESPICLNFGKQWVQTSKSDILKACQSIIGIGEPRETPEPKLRESLKFLKRFNQFFQVS